MVAAKNRRRRPTNLVSPRLADDLPRHPRHSRSDPDRAQDVLFGRRDGAFQGDPEPDHLSLARAGACPEGPLELHGTIDNVVFPTGIDRRDDLGRPDRFDVYYGMADNRIGVARLTCRRHYQ